MGFYLNKATAQKQTRAHTYLQMKMRTKPLGYWLLPLVVAVLLSSTQRVVADENDIFPDLLDLQDIPGCTLDPSLKFDEIDEVYFEVQALNCMDYNDTFVPFPDPAAVAQLQGLRRARIDNDRLQRSGDPGSERIVAWP